MTGSSALFRIYLGSEARGVNLAFANIQPALYPPAMSDLSTLTAAQLRQAAVIQEQIEALNHELAKVLNGSSGPELEPAQDAEPVKVRKKYKLSAAGKAAKIAGQKARWAKIKAAKARV